MGELSLGGVKRRAGVRILHGVRERASVSQLGRGVGYRASFGAVSFFFAPAR
jgi:hypothetical protein